MFSWNARAALKSPQKPVRGLTPRSCVYCTCAGELDPVCNWILLILEELGATLFCLRPRFTRSPRVNESGFIFSHGSNLSLRAHGAGFREICMHTNPAGPSGTTRSVHCLPEKWTLCFSNGFSRETHKLRGLIGMTFHHEEIQEKWTLYVFSIESFYTKN